MNQSFLASSLNCSQVPIRCFLFSFSRNGAGKYYCYDHVLLYWCISMKTVQLWITHCTVIKSIIQISAQNQHRTCEMTCFSSTYRQALSSQSSDAECERFLGFVPESTASDNNAEMNVSDSCHKLFLFLSFLFSNLYGRLWKTRSFRFPSGVSVQVLITVICTYSLR